MKKLTTLLIAIFVISSSFFAQLGEIKGIIKDKNTGERLFGATVYIETAGNKIGDASDPDGKYTIKPVNVGKHAVYVSALGYKKTKIIDVLVTSDKITHVDIGLDIGVINMKGYDKIVYREPLISKDQPGVQQIPLKTFQRNANRVDPILAISSMTSGVTVGPNGKDVMIRGSRPASTQFITDGVKSITGEIGIPGQAIGSIKVYTSGVPARYGDVSGGVIVVETKSYFDLAQGYK
jgi:hypothetical protein